MTPSTITYGSLGKTGQLGNQMFEIATVLAVGMRHPKCKVVFPSILHTLPISKLFDLSSLEIQDFKYYNVHIDECENYEDIHIPDDGRVYDIRGYRQSFRYFDDIKPYLKELFVPRTCYIDETRIYSTDIIVHVRRGDSLKWYRNYSILRTFSICTDEYYKESGGIKQVLCSTDDPKYVIQNLGYKCTRRDIYFDWTLMYLAKKLVISISTFSWWAAYLGEHEEVVAPSSWWHPGGLIPYIYNLDDPRHLKYPGWTYRDPTTGELVKEEDVGKSRSTPYILKLIRGVFI